MESNSDINTSNTKKFWIIGGIVAAVLVVVTVVVIVVVKPFNSKAPPPPVDCVVSDWNWGNCGYDGLRPGTRTVTTPSANGGAACPPLTTTQECAAPVDCVVSDWNWGNCGYDGVRSGTRKVITPSANGGLECPTDLTDTKECAAPVDCVVSDWNWESCLRNSRQNGSREVTTRPANGGAPCPTDLTTSRYCDTPPVDCEVSEWGSWSSCGRDSKQTATRTVLKEPKNGGDACQPLTKTQDCNNPIVDCVVSDWVWGVCGRDSKQNGTRTVLKEPKNGGNSCPVLTTTRDCDGPVDCVVADPVVYNPCNYSNKSQTKTSVIIKAPKNGGTACGPLRKTQSCTTSGPYVYTTQVFAQQNPSGLFSQTGVPPGWGPVNFTSYGGLCVIDLNFTAWSPSPNNIGVFALLIDGVAQLPLINFFFNASGQHFTIPSVFLSLYLSPGVHKFSLSVNYSVTNTPVNVDTTDYIWLRVVEYSQQLVAGPKPSVYVTNVFNQTRPVPAGEVFTGPGSPPGWTKTVVCHGGVVVVDLNFTAYASVNDQHTFFALIVDSPRTPLIYWYNNVYTNIHKTVPASFTFYELSAGPHLFSIHTNYGTNSRALVDGNDTLNMRITEFSSSLFLPSPLVTIIPIMVMSRINGSHILGSNVDILRESTRQFFTNGGICVFNTSCSGWVNARHNPSDHNMITFRFKFTNANSKTSVNNAKNGDGVITTYYNGPSQEFFVENYFFMNVRTEHRVVNCNFIIDNLPAGAHFVTILGNGNTFVDTGDTFNMRLIEFSPTLTSGTPPAVPAPFSASNPRPNFQGCYNDNVNNQRAFNNMVDNQSLAQCNTIAKTAESPYFGMQNWQKAGGITSMDTGECWFQKGSTLQSAESQGESTNCSDGPGRYTIGGSNTNAVYETS
jgi:hypothetical protein